MINLNNTARWEKDHSGTNVNHLQNIVCSYWSAVNVNLPKSNVSDDHIYANNLKMIHNLMYTLLSSPLLQFLNFGQSKENFHIHDMLLLFEKKKTCSSTLDINIHFYTLHRQKNRRH